MTADVLQFVTVVESSDCETNSKCTEHPPCVYNKEMLVLYNARVWIAPSLQQIAQTAHYYMFNVNKWSFIIRIFSNP